MAYSKRGLLAAAAAFTSWGLLPLYWKLLSHLPAMEVLAHRVLWSFAFLFMFQIGARRLPKLLQLEIRLSTFLVIVFSGALIAGNWLVYVMAINSGNVLESSLGYFINPLFIVFLGAVFFGERLRVTQLFAISLAFAGVLLAAWSYGRVPYYALALSGTMGVYALTKKYLALPSVESLSLEMTTVVAPAVLFLVLNPGSGEVGDPLEFGELLLFISTGLVTAIPLLWFAFAAKELPMYGLGLMQYLSPSLQFGLAIFVFGEAFEPGKAVAFVLIWFAIAAFLFEGRVYSRKQKRQARTLQEVERAQVAIPSVIQESAMSCSSS